MPPPARRSDVQLFNCSSEQHTVEVWVQDMYQRHVVRRQGPLAATVRFGRCVAPGSLPFNSIRRQRPPLPVVATTRLCRPLDARRSWPLQEHRTGRVTPRAGGRHDPSFVR